MDVPRPNYNKPVSPAKSKPKSKKHKSKTTTPDLVVETSHRSESEISESDYFTLHSDLLKVNQRKISKKIKKSRAETFKTTRAYKILPTSIKSNKFYEESRLIGFRSLAITTNCSPLGNDNFCLSPTINTARLQAKAKNKTKNRQQQRSTDRLHSSNTPDSN